MSDLELGNWRVQPPRCHAPPRAAPLEGRPPLCAIIADSYSGESQKAFNLLQKRLKPLEHYQPVPYDFYSLAYLTSASTVHDAPGLRDWAGAGPERERLVQMWRELTEGRRPVGSGDLVAPTDRLLTLLKQAVAWQVQNARPRGAGPWAVPTLLTDYVPPAVPSRLERLIKGHRANVKCVDWLSDTLGVSGSR